MNLTKLYDLIALFVYFNIGVTLLIGMIFAIKQRWWRFFRVFGNHNRMLINELVDRVDGLYDEKRTLSNDFYDRIIRIENRLRKIEHPKIKRPSKSKLK